MKRPARAEEKWLIALEDACHAQGASLHGRPMGTWPGIGCFSFQASRPLPAIEGGLPKGLDAPQAACQGMSHPRRGAPPPLRPRQRPGEPAAS
ncbi:MAG: hypothetical protein GXY25_11850 [Pirellulaceae bacterium]|nr:DegT/DnrJ/EryC1/StrS family aminotransferase [Planctomycetota bacterium]NLZ01218.1 hypothetical protein [Pirellulaceae bacterium]